MRWLRLIKRFFDVKCSCIIALDDYTYNDKFLSQINQVPEYPGKVFFYCEIEPAEGGETPILPSHLAYERMEKEWPDFVQKLLKDGLLYTRVLGEGDDPSSPIGRGWQSTFLTKDRLEAEKRFAFNSRFFIPVAYAIQFHN